MRKAKKIDTVEDDDLKVDWYSCGCIRSYHKYDKHLMWQIDEKVNPSGKCSQHKKAFI